MAELQWALPVDRTSGVSAWSRGASLEAVVAAPRELDIQPHRTSDESDKMLVDPPWAETEGEREEARVGGSARPTPSPIGLDLAANTIELVKRDGSYAVVLDGVEQTDGVDRFWVPRFRERVVVVDEKERRAVAPVFASVRLEADERPPLRVEVTVEQTIVDEGVRLLEGAVVLREELRPYTTDDLQAPVSVLMYPMVVTQPPTISVVDNDVVRRHEFRRERYNKGRVASVVGSVFSAIANLASGTNNDPLASVGQAIAKEMGKTYQNVGGTYNTWAGVWRIAAVFATPSLRNLLEAGFSYYQYVGGQYDKDHPEPQTGKVYDMSITEFTAVLRRIAETRANGQMLEDKTLGLSPLELRKRGMLEESAVLYWLCYGRDSVKPDDSSTPKDEKLTGNFLVPTGLDPLHLARRRVEYTIVLTTTERDGETQRFVFDSVRANGIDAGYIAQGCLEQIKALEAQIEATTKTIEDLKSVGLHWLHDRLFVGDSTDGRMFGSGSSWWSRLRPGGISDAQKRQRWWSLTKEARAGTLRPTLVIDVGEFKKRLNDVLGEIETTEQRVARVAERKTAVGLREEVLDGREGPPVPQREGVSEELKQEDDPYNQTYDEALKAAVDKCRRGMGWASRATDGDDAVLRPSSAWFLRWSDAHMPIGPRYYARLRAFDVPPAPSYDAVRDPPSLVRRLPQVAEFATSLVSNFGTTSLMAVRPVPDDALSDRASAKSAVDACRRVMVRSVADFRAMRWTLEEGRALHFVQLWRPRDGATAESLLSGLPPLRAAGLTMHTLGTATVVGLDTALAETEAEHTIGAQLRNQREVAAGHVRLGDADVLQQLGLPQERVALAAVRAYAQIVAHKATTRAGWLARADLATSVVQDANTTAAAVAHIVELLYGVRARRGDFVPRDDLLFGCLPDGEHARACLEFLDAWRRTEALEAGRPLKDVLTDVARGHATRFATALARIGTLKRLHPLRLPLVNVQSLWLEQKFEVQLVAAMQAHARVNEMLVSATRGQSTRRAHLAALCTIVASRPVLLVSTADDVDREHLQRAVEGGVGRRVLRGVHPPEPQHAAEALRLRCAGLRLDAVDTLAPELFRRDKLESVDALIDRVTSLGLGEVADYFVPPGAPGRATPMDLSHSAAIEDAPVWLAALRKSVVCARPRDGAPTADTWRVVALPSLVKGRVRHPFLIRVGAKRVELHLARVPARAAGLEEPDELPGSVAAVVERMRGAASEPTLTGALRDRASEMLFNVDRWWQTLMLLEAHRVQTEPVAFKTGDADVLLAYAIAHAMRATTFTSAVEVGFHPSSPERREAMRTALDAMDALVRNVTATAAVPLGELVLCLAAHA